jgi:CBS domain-containing protein
VDEPEYTRKKVREFLSHHSAYELIPESGKVVLLDLDLPVRQAFHALHEQGAASAPLYDAAAGAVCGIISASDFIATLQRLRSVVSSSANPMSEVEMDEHTIRDLREGLAAEGRPLKPLVYLQPGDTLAAVVRALFDNHCSMAPVLQPPAPDADAAAGGPEVLHSATMSGVLACLMRHFRASLTSLPLLAQPLGTLPLGTWAPGSSVAAAAAAEAQHPPPGGLERRDLRRIAPIRTVTAHTPLSDALGMLLEAGISCLPVVDDSGALTDIYARADITTLAKSNAYSRMQFEDVTVGQALSLAAAPPAPPQLGSSQAGQWGGVSPSSSTASMHDAGAAAAAHKHRVYMCTTRDALRSVVERLSVPGVRRVIVVDGDTRRVEGIVSLSDIAAYLLL